MPDAIKWTSPPTLPGVQTAWVLGAGDKAGPYLLRGKLAPGARIPPHTHPEERNGTVLSGTAYVGFTPTFDESKAIAIPAGGVWVAPSNVPHFIWAKDGGVVFQCAGVGPSGTNFIKP
jgi:quercetin dioxygenase-like cupin family protein